MRSRAAGLQNRVTIVACPAGMYEIYQGRGLWGVASTPLEAEQVQDECLGDLEEQRAKRRTTPWRGPQQALDPRARYREYPEGSPR